MRKKIQPANQLQRKYDLQNIAIRLLALAVKKTSPEKILKQCLNMIFEVPWLDLDKTGCIFVAEENSGFFEMKAQRSIDKKNFKECRKIRSGQCLCGLAAKNKKIVFAGQTNNAHTIKENPAPHGHYCVPIMFKKKVMGVLNIRLQAGHKRSNVEEKFLSAIACTLAEIIHGEKIDRTHEQARTEKNQTEKQLLESYKHLGIINRQISILLDLYTQSGGKNAREILEYITKSAYNLSRAESIKFFRYSKSTHSFIFLPIGNSRKFKDEKTRIPLDKHVFLKPLIEKKIRVQGSFIEKLHQDFVSPGSAVKYFLFLPIISGKKLRGTLLFCFSDRDSITPQELDFFEAFAIQASLVLKNLEIFKEKRIKNPPKKPASQLKLFQPIKKARQK